MTRAVTLILPYYENTGMLKHQYASVRRLPDDLRSCIRVIVVDDGSPTKPAKPEDIGTSLTIFRMSQDIPWNQDACRNLAVNQCQTKWMLLTDVDHLIPGDTFAEIVVSPAIRPDKVYQFTRVTLEASPDEFPWQTSPYKLHPNTWFMTRYMYEFAGGYDERFAGWYGTDGDFRARVLRCAEVVHLGLPIVRVPREVVPDASTTQYDRKTAKNGEEIKRIKKEREREEDWVPRRLLFPWTRVYTSEKVR